MRLEELDYAIYNLVAKVGLGLGSKEEENFLRDLNNYLTSFFKEWIER